MWPSATPTASELSAAVQPELSPYGGHVGFVAGSAPWRARYWLEERMPEFLADHLNGLIQSPL